MVLGGYERGLICTIKQFINLINKLNNLNVYEDSLIIIKSDHGEPVNYFTDTPNSYKINNHTLWGYNRYKPLLMIKNFNQKLNQIDINNSFVGLPDLAKTICIYANLKNCEQYIGIDLFSKNIQENPIIYIDVVIDEKSDFRANTHKTIQIDRSKYSNLLKAMKDHKEIILSTN